MLFQFSSCQFMLGSGYILMDFQLFCLLFVNCVTANTVKWHASLKSASQFLPTCDTSSGLFLLGNQLLGPFSRSLGHFDFKCMFFFNLCHHFHWFTGCNLGALYTKPLRRENFHLYSFILCCENFQRRRPGTPHICYRSKLFLGYSIFKLVYTYVGSSRASLNVNFSVSLATKKKTGNWLLWCNSPLWQCFLTLDWLRFVWHISLNGKSLLGWSWCACGTLHRATCTIFTRFWAVYPMIHHATCSCNQFITLMMTMSLSWSLT